MGGNLVVHLGIGGVCLDDLQIYCHPQTVCLPFLGSDSWEGIVLTLYESYSRGPGPKPSILPGQGKQPLPTGMDRLLLIR